MTRCERLRKSIGWPLFGWLVWGLSGAVALAAAPKPSSRTSKPTLRRVRSAPKRKQPAKVQTGAKKPAVGPATGKAGASGAALPRLPGFGGRSIQLSALMKLSHKRDPTSQHMRKLVNVLQQRQRKAGAWPDLNVGINVSSFPLNSFNPTTTPMSGIEYSISQRFPILKRLSLQRKLAGFDVKMLKAQLRERRSSIRFQLLRELIELAYIRKALATRREEYRLMRQAAAVAKTRYSVNRAPQQNWFQALTAQAQLRSEMIGLVAEAQRRRHRMALWLGSGLKALQGRAVVSRPTVWPNAKQAATQGLRHRGEALRWWVAAQKAKVLLSFARVSYWPDVTVQLSVRQRFPNPMDDGVPFLSLGIKVPIPSWGNASRHGLVKEAMALHVYARSRRKALMALWLSQARIALSQAQQFQQQRKVATSQTIPLALQTYRSALANYQVGKVSFLTLMGNLRTIYREKLRLHRLDANIAIAHATLEGIQGKVD